MSQDVGNHSGEKFPQVCIPSGDFGETNSENESSSGKRVQIHSLKEISNSNETNFNSPDVQFILEVKRSNVKVSSMKNEGI